MKRVFVVTGSNKGIGKSIVRNLLKESQEKIVYLTSRNENAGLAAVKDLETEGLHSNYHQLDVSCIKSIEVFAKHLLDNHGGFDVLVNNAGIAFKGNDSVPFLEQVKATLDCNFYGIIRVCDILLPMLKKNGRVVNISSMVSEWTYKKLSSDVKNQFADSNLTMQGLQDIMKDFVQSAQDNQVLERGFTMSAYGMSKVGVSFLSQLQQKEIDVKYPEKNILLNYCCPGFVSTDLTGGKGRLTADEGADTPTYLALLPTTLNEPKGKFHKLRKIAPYPPLIE